MSKHRKVTFLIGRMTNTMFCGGVERNKHGKVTFLIGKMPNSLSSEGGRRYRKAMEACGTP
jgi:hypothetical protein